MPRLSSRLDDVLRHGGLQWGLGGGWSDCN